MRTGRAHCPLPFGRGSGSPKSPVSSPPSACQFAPPASGLATVAGSPPLPDAPGGASPPMPPPSPRGVLGRATSPLYHEVCIFPPRAVSLYLTYAWFNERVFGIVLAPATIGDGILQ
ncbi:hypothetical protein ACP70R_049970 [Stipagrostis hirtigluma subsp. patula]